MEPNPDLCFCGCGSSLEGRRSDCVWASDSCAKEWKRANPGKQAPKAAQRRERADKARTRRRTPTTFLVIERPVVVREIKARDRREALRALNGSSGDVVLVPERAVARPK